MDKVPLKIFKLQPQAIVAIADVTFWGRGYGVLVIRSFELKQNLYWAEVTSQTADCYRQARQTLEGLGFTFKAIVLDGRRGIKEVFSDLPVQICQFHQIQAINRYLTTKPKLEAGQELRMIVKVLPRLTESSFGILLNEWHEKWKDFLKERTFSEDREHWQYTHRRIRSAFRSLKTNFAYLFTYQYYPNFKIPNTTNSLDGSFSHLKDLSGLHRGLKRQRRWKLVQEALAK